MKKLFSLIIVLCVALSSACNSTLPIEPTATPSFTIPAETIAPTPAPTTAPTAEPTATPSMTPISDLYDEAGIIDPKLLYSLYPNEAEAGIEAILNGRSFDALSSNEQHNVLLLNYFLEPWEYDDSNFASNYTAYQHNREVMEDINGDGKDDCIKVVTFEDGFTLWVNDISVTFDRYWNMCDTFAIVDIDTSDKYKEIVISDYGDSNDDTSIFFYYTGKEIVSLDRANEQPLEHYPFSIYSGVYADINCTGDGTITVMHRSGILQTWYYPKTYKLTKNRSLQAVRELYKVNYKVFVCRNIELFTKMDDKSPTFMLERSQVVYLTALDDIEWIQITLSDGRTGWFKMISFNMMISGDAVLDTLDVFYRLSYAD